MKINNGKTTTKRMHYCPACNKPRLKLPIGQEPNKSKGEFDLPDGEKVELFVQVCEFCVQKYYKKYWQPKKADAKKVLQALELDRELPEDTSLEELL